MDLARRTLCFAVPMMGMLSCADVRYYQRARMVGSIMSSHRMCGGELKGMKLLRLFSSALLSKVAGTRVLSRTRNEWTASCKPSLLYNYCTLSPTNQRVRGLSRVRADFRHRMIVILEPYIRTHPCACCHHLGRFLWITPPGL